MIHILEVRKNREGKPSEDFIEDLVTISSRRV